MHAAFTGFMLGKGVLYNESAALKCRRGTLYAPLWMEKNRRVLAVIYENSYQGSCKVLSFDFSRELFFIHEWDWGSCEACDSYLSACDELWRQDYYGETEPSQYLSQNDLDEQFREELETRATSYTASELLKLRELYLNQDKAHYMIDVIGYILGFVEDVPKTDEWIKFEFYARLDNIGLPGQPPAEKILIDRKVKAFNKKEKFSNNPFADVLKKGRNTVH